MEKIYVPPTPCLNKDYITCLTPLAVCFSKMREKYQSGPPFHRWSTHPGHHPTLSRQSGGLLFQDSPGTVQRSKQAQVHLLPVGPDETFPGWCRRLDSKNQVNCWEASPAITKASLPTRRNYLTNMRELSSTSTSSARSPKDHQIPNHLIRFLDSFSVTFRVTRQAQTTAREMRFLTSLF